MAHHLRLDVRELVDAMTRGPDMEAWLDPTTGRINQRPTDDIEDEDDSSDELARDEGLDVPLIEGRTVYRWMAEFAAGLNEADVRRELEIALDGAGAFGRFRRAIGCHPDLRSAWERLHDDRVLERAREWLEAEGITPTFVRSGPESVQRPVPQEEQRIGLQDLLLLGAPDGKTELLEGRVLRVLIAPSASEARRIFANIARDLCEAHGTAWRRRFIEGQTAYEVGRYHLTIDDTRIDLEVDVSPALWRAFAS